MPPPGLPSGGGSRVGLIIAAAVVVLVVLIGGGITAALLLTGDDDDDSDDRRSSSDNSETTSSDDEPSEDEEPDGERSEDEESEPTDDPSDATESTNGTATEPDPADLQAAEGVVRLWASTVNDGSCSAARQVAASDFARTCNDDAAAWPSGYRIFDWEGTEQVGDEIRIEVGIDGFRADKGIDTFRGVFVLAKGTGGTWLIQRFEKDATVTSDD